jgi:hypothetical protein
MSSKKKYQLLWLGISLFCLIAWWLAFSKTWSAYQQSKQIQNQLVEAGSAWQEIEYYEQQLNQIEEQNNRPFTPSLLFNEVTNFCQEKQLSILQMPASTIYKEQGIEILHNPIKVKGDFVPIVELLYELEQQQQLGNIVSVEFETKRNVQNRQKELSATFYLQNIKTKP